MLTFEDAQEALTQIADTIPQKIYEQLNGGILLLPETKRHPQSGDGPLYILGEYHYEPRGFGRYITIYYGSFCLVHGRLSREAQIEKLQGILHHELTHHLENLAGDRSLEIQDAIDLASYKRRTFRSDVPETNNP